MNSNYFINPHLFNSAYAGIEDTQAERGRLRRIRYLEIHGIY